MANVKFLKGTQANIAKYLEGGTSSAIEGAFYLTTDTDRLYVGRNVSTTSTPSIKAVPVNQGVIVCNTVNDLPNASSTNQTGHFYYVTTGNILCVATAGQWVQINTNTNDDHFADERTVVATQNGKIVSVADKIFLSNESRIATNYDYKAGDGLDVAVEAKYVQATAYHSGIDYYTESGGVYTKTVITQAPATWSGYYVIGGYEITFTPAAYSLTKEAITGGGAKIKLSNGVVANDTTVSFIAGTNVTVTDDTDGIKISATDSTINSVTGANGGSGSGTDKINGFKFTVADTSGASKTGTIDPLISFGTGANASSVHFVNGTATLNVYTADEVDAKIKDFNAMEYKGTITSTSLPPAQVKNGWVYMAAGDVTLSSNAGHAGDLFVAQGTEGADGYITSATLTWGYIPSGNDTDTITLFTGETHGFKLNESTDGGTTTGAMIGKFLLDTPTGKDYISLTDGTNDPAGTKSISIAHKEVAIGSYGTAGASGGDYSWQLSTDQTMTQGVEGTPGSIDIYVPTISWDGAGHITNFVKHKYTIYDTHGSITESSFKTTITNSSAASLQWKFKFDGAAKYANMAVTTNTLSFSQSGTDGLNIDMVWGTFE